MNHLIAAYSHPKATENREIQMFTLRIQQKRSEQRFSKKRYSSLLQLRVTAEVRRKEDEQHRDLRSCGTEQPGASGTEPHATRDLTHRAR